MYVGKGAGIELNGVFMNADAGFDAEALRQQCSQRNIEANTDSNPRKGKHGDACVYFDEVIVQETLCHRMNQCLDCDFKALLVRYEGRAASWFQQLSWPSPSCCSEKSTYVNH